MILLILTINKWKSSGPVLTLSSQIGRVVKKKKKHDRLGFIQGIIEYIPSVFLCIHIYIYIYCSYFIVVDMPILRGRVLSPI